MANKDLQPMPIMTIKQELAVMRRIWRWFEQLPTCSVDFLIDREMCKRLARGQSQRLANVVIYRESRQRGEEGK